MKTKSNNLFDRFWKTASVPPPISIKETVPKVQTKRATETFYGVWLDKEMLRKLKFMALERETNVKRLVSEAIRRYLVENST